MQMDSWALIEPISHCRESGEQVEVPPYGQTAYNEQEVARGPGHVLLDATRWSCGGGEE